MKIYQSATPFIHGILEHPPKTWQEKAACTEETAAFNKRIREQNEKDGLEGDRLNQFYINTSAFETNATMLAPQLEKLRKNKNDQNAKKWVTTHNATLEDVVKMHGYPASWTFKGMMEAKYGQGESGNSGGKRGPGMETGGTGTGAGTGTAGPKGQNARQGGNAAQAGAASGDNNPIAKWKPG